MSAATLGQEALKGAKVGGNKSTAAGYATGSVNVGGFNVPAYGPGGLSPWYIGGVAVVLLVGVVLIARK